MCVCVCVHLLAQLCLTLCDPMDYSPPGSSVHGKNNRVGCHSLLQDIFPTQGVNMILLHCGQILYHLSHQGRPLIMIYKFLTCLCSFSNLDFRRFCFLACHNPCIDYMGNIVAIQFSSVGISH